MSHNSWQNGYALFSKISRNGTMISLTRYSKFACSLRRYCHFTEMIGSTRSRTRPSPIASSHISTTCRKGSLPSTSTLYRLCRARFACVDDLAEWQLAAVSIPRPPLNPCAWYRISCFVVLYIWKSCNDITSSKSFSSQILPTIGLTHRLYISGGSFDCIPHALGENAIGYRLTTSSSPNMNCRSIRFAFGINARWTRSDIPSKWCVSPISVARAKLILSIDSTTNFFEKSLPYYPQK